VPQLLSPEVGTIVVVADSTLARLGSVAERRWGLVTTAQAENAGVSRKQLARMASAGAIERVAQGVYRMAGAPQQDHEAIYAAWLALGGARPRPVRRPCVRILGAARRGRTAPGSGGYFQLPDSPSDHVHFARCRPGWLLREVASMPSATSGAAIPRRSHFFYDLVQGQVFTCARPSPYVLLETPAQ
jgi:Transcriptional regulator, AbiEi antitoxin